MDYSDFEGKTFLITGATGMIGSCLIDLLMEWNQCQRAPCHVIAVSRTEASAKKRFGYCWDSPNFTFCEQNVCVPMQDITGQIDYMIHAASYADPLSFKTHPVDILLANVLGTDNLLKYGKSHGLKRFLYVSSGEIYGQSPQDNADFVESYCGPVDYSSPRSCYPAGKRAGESLCQAYIDQYRLDIVIARPCHIFGPTMTDKDSKAASEFLRNAAGKRNIVMRSAGKKERSHCYVVDAANAIFHILKRGTCGEAYNIADRKYQMTIFEFAQTAAEIGSCEVVLDLPNESEYLGYSKIQRSVLDPSKLERIGWRAFGSFPDGIKNTIEILREREK